MNASCISMHRISQGTEGKAQESQGYPSHMKRFLPALSSLLLAGLSLAAQTLNLTVLHTNDLHGMLRPHNYKSEAYPKQNEDNVGGLARRSFLINQIRKTSKSPVLYIDLGDTFTRGPWHLLYFGEPEMQALNFLGCEAMAVGNNEFKANLTTSSQDVFKKLCRQARFPWLAANLTQGDTGVPVEGIRPLVVRTIGGVKVGLLGLTAPRSKDYEQTKGWTISDPIEAARIWVPKARKECDVLIAMTHIGFDLDQELAAKVPGIDAIVGGDSHTLLEKPTWVKSPDGRNVPIVQAGEMGVWLGQLDLTFEKSASGWSLKTGSGKVIKLDKTVKEDPAMLQLLGKWVKVPQPKPVSIGLRRAPAAG